MSDPLTLLTRELAVILHEENDRFKAAVVLAKRFSQPRPNNEREALTLLNEFLHSLLYHDRDEEAAAFLWAPGVFDGRPECVQMIWSAYAKESLLGLQGGSSMGKSYTPCVRLMLDWLRDPEWTSILCVGPKEQHLKDNVFSTLVRLHTSACIPLPGEVGDLFIGMSRRDSFGGFKGVVIPRGAKGVVLQGMTKAQKRTGPPHPRYGVQGRVRVFVDEIEDCPALIHQDLANVMSGIDKSNPDRLKIIVAYNPKYASGPVAAMAEPQKGWDAFDLDEDIDWISKRGWRILRLDPHRSENVINDNKEFGGLQTRDALDALRSQSGGEDTSTYYTFGRGAFPRTSASTAAVPQAWLTQSLGSVTWVHAPETHLGGDLALGGDATVLAELKVGIINSRRWQGWEDDPQRTMFFPRPRPCILLERFHFIPGKETVALARLIKQVGITLPCKPYNVNLDPGGPGHGIVDVVRELWDSEVMRTFGGEGASEKRILEEDHSVAKDSLRYAVDEMWLALRKYFEHGFIVVSEKMPMEQRTRLFTELTTRLWRDPTMTKIEPKQEYRRRNGGRSPDCADSLSLGVHSARMRGSFRPSIRDGARRLEGAPAAERAPLSGPPPGALIFGDPKELLEEALHGGPSSRHVRDGCDECNRYETL